MILLRTEIKKKIKDDVKLFNSACDVLNIKQATLNKYLKEDSTRLTEIDFLTHLAEQTNLPGSKLLTGGKISQLLLK